MSPHLPSLVTGWLSHWPPTNTSRLRSALKAPSFSLGWPICFYFFHPISPCDFYLGVIRRPGAERPTGFERLITLDMELEPNSRRFLIAYNVLVIASIVLIILVLLPPLFCKRVHRRLPWYSHMLAWLVASVALLLLIGHQSDDQPPTGLCFVQSALLYATPPLSVISWNIWVDIAVHLTIGLCVTLESHFLWLVTCLTYVFPILPSRVNTISRKLTGILRSIWHWTHSWAKNHCGRGRLRRQLSWVMALVLSVITRLLIQFHIFEAWILALDRLLGSHNWGVHRESHSNGFHYEFWRITEGFCYSNWRIWTKWQSRTALVLSLQQQNNVIATRLSTPSLKDALLKPILTSAQECDQWIFDLDCRGYFSFGQR
jgi:hypothetical protein